MEHERVEPEETAAAADGAETMDRLRQAMLQADARRHEAERVAEEAEHRAAKAEQKAHLAQRSARVLASNLEAERRSTTARTRQTPLAIVLDAAGWQQDLDDPNVWRGPGSLVRLDREREFWDEQQGCGGNNAVTLARHLTGRAFEDAVAWLAEMVGWPEAQASARVAVEDMAERLPEPHETLVPELEAWPATRRYLVEEQRLSELLVDRLMRDGVLVPQRRGFFLRMQDPEGVEVGAEFYDLAGQRGLARGSSLDRGGIQLRQGSPGMPCDVYLTESGLDAASLHDLIPADPKCAALFVSAGVARSSVPWLGRLLREDDRLFVAYGTSPASHRAGTVIMAQFPAVSVRHAPAEATWSAQLLAARYAGYDI